MDQVDSSDDVEDDGAPMEEKLQGSVFSTGYKGGDAGHGGQTDVRFSGGQTGQNFFLVTLLDGSVQQFQADEVASVHIVAMGDWEQSGLYWALVDIVDGLKPKLGPRD